MTRRKHVLIVTVSTIALQIALAVAPMFPSIATKLQTASGSTKPEVIVILVVGIQIALLSGGVAFQLLGGQDAIETLAARLSSDPARIDVAQVRDDDFYVEFLRAIRQAKHTVLISYFSPHSPVTGAPPERIKYYERLAGVIASRPDLHFRRLIVNTPSNVDWLRAQIARLDRVVNIDIAILDDAIPNRGMPLPLSVQVIDDQHVWLVAIADHERTAKGYRDLYLGGERAADAFRDYYDRLWGRATVLFEKGSLTPFGRATFSKSANQ